MSRGFVREDDQEEAPFIPPRAPLPPGATNYVTERGLGLLHAERDALERERATATGSEDERRRMRAEIDGRLALLQERIVTARVVPVAEGSLEDVRFGATVTLVHVEGPPPDTTRTFTIVGVDEASVAEARIAFTAPIARVLIGRRVGDVITLPTGKGPQRLRVDAIR